MSIEAARMVVLNLLAGQRIGPEDARLLLEALDANPERAALPSEPARPEAPAQAPARPEAPAQEPARLYGADAGAFQAGEHPLVRAQTGGRQVLEAGTRIEQAAATLQAPDWGAAYSSRPEGSPAVRRPDPVAGGAPGVSVSTVPGSRLSSPRTVAPVPDDGQPTVPGVSIVHVPPARPGSRSSSPSTTREPGATVLPEDSAAGVGAQAAPSTTSSQGGRFSTRPRQAAPEVARSSPQPERGRRRLEVGVTSRAWPTGTVQAASRGAIEGPAPVSSSPVLPPGPESVVPSRESGAPPDGPPDEDEADRFRVIDF